MSDCDSLRDRMPDVLHGTDTWSDADMDHLRRCADCQLEWRLVQAGGALDAGVHVSAERVAASVLQSLRSEPAPRRLARRWVWSGVSVGLAAAASIAFVLLLPRPHPSVQPANAAAATVSILPELQSLDDAQLEEILRSLDQTDVQSSPGPVPRLGDLTDSELEELLRSEGGE